MEAAMRQVMSQRSQAKAGFHSQLLLGLSMWGSFQKGMLSLGKLDMTGLGGGVVSWEKGRESWKGRF